MKSCIYEWAFRYVCPVMWSWNEILNSTHEQGTQLQQELKMSLQTLPGCWTAVWALCFEASPPICCLSATVGMGQPVSVAPSTCCACIFFSVYLMEFYIQLFTSLTFMSLGWTWVVHKDLWEQRYAIASVIRKKNKQVVNLMQDFSASWQLGAYLVIPLTLGLVVKWDV